MSMQQTLGLASETVVQHVITNIMKLVFVFENTPYQQKYSQITTRASRSTSAQWLQYQRLVVIILTKEMIAEDQVAIEYRSTSVIKYDIGYFIEIRWHVSWFGSLPTCCQHIFGILLDNADEVLDSSQLTYTPKSICPGVLRVVLRM
jgi:hypothetical protein